MCSGVWTVETPYTRKEIVSMSMERFTAVFVILALISMVAVAGYKMTIDRDCVQTAIQQNYSAEAIKKICR